MYNGFYPRILVFVFSFLLVQRLNALSIPIPSDLAKINITNSTGPPHGLSAWPPAPYRVPLRPPGGDLLFEDYGSQLTLLQQVEFTKFIQLLVSRFQQPFDYAAKSFVAVVPDDAESYVQSYYFGMKLQARPGVPFVRGLVGYILVSIEGQTREKGVQEMSVILEDVPDATGGFALASTHPLEPLELPINVNPIFVLVSQTDHMTIEITDHGAEWDMEDTTPVFDLLDRFERGIARSSSGDTFAGGTTTVRSEGKQLVFDMQTRAPSFLNLRAVAVMKAMQNFLVDFIACDFRFNVLLMDKGVTSVIGLGSLSRQENKVLNGTTGGLRPWSTTVQTDGEVFS